MYKNRHLENIILKITKTFKVLYLGGPRQVGKTTLLSYLAQKRKMNYISFDDISLRQLAKQDPALFLEDHPRPLFIDEIQYVPELLPYIKLKVDQSSQLGQYWLTGSQQFKVMKNLQESLAGRVGILHLLGFSLSEIKEGQAPLNPFLPKQDRPCPKMILNPTQIFTYLFKGFYPALYQKPTPDRNIFFSSYIQSYLDRDLRDIYGIAKVAEFHRFVQLCAARTAQLLNYSDLARDAGISVNAAREWIDILQSTMQIYLLQPYHANLSKRLIKSPKLYFLDTGLASYLSKWQTVETLRHGAMSGAFFENFVVSEVIKSYLFQGLEAPLFYFRDKEGHEVDLLIETEDKLYPVEIKLASQIKDEHIINIRYLQERNKKISTGTVICLANRRYRFQSNIEVLPVGMLS